MNNSLNDFDFDVAIIGGGISGIAAAHTLSGSQKKLNWALFEASQRLGGRIQSIAIDGKIIDTGAYQLASFLQNRPQKIQLYELIKNGLCQVNHFHEKYNKIYYYDQTGDPFDQKTIKKINEKIDELRQLAKEWVQKQQNLSLRQSCTRYMASKQYEQLNQAQKRLFQLIVVMQEHEEAADGQNLPAEILFDNDELQGDLIDAYPIPSITYNGIVQKIIKELPKDSKINFNNFVTNIKRQSDHCVIQVKQKKGQDQYETKVYKCRYVICAVPLPIIKNKIIEIEPKIPQSHSFIFDNLGFGFMEKIILSFQERFWPEDTQRIKVACNKRGKFPHFVNLSGLNENKQETHILVCFITAKFVQQTMNNYSDKEIVQLAVQQLRIAFPNSNIKLKDSHVTRWIKDKNINGAFSYAMPNLRFKKAKQIRKPIDNLLWFVGEYCYPQNIGCAHGAFETGYLAAKQIESMQSLKN